MDSHHWVRLILTRKSAYISHQESSHPRQPGHTQTLHIWGFSRSLLSAQSTWRHCSCLISLSVTSVVLWLDLDTSGELGRVFLRIRDMYTSSGYWHAQNLRGRIDSRALVALNEKKYFMLLLKTLECTAHEAVNVQKQTFSGHGSVTYIPCVAMLEKFLHYSSTCCNSIRGWSR